MGKTLFSTAVGLVLLAFALVPATASAVVNAVCTDNSGCSAGEYCQLAEKQTRGLATGLCRATGSSNSSGGGADSLSCQARARTLLKTCEQSQTDAAYWCDSNNNEGMGSVMNTASQLGVLAGSAAASSVTASCSNMASLAQAANGAVAAFKLSCAGYISSCSTACDAVVSFLKRNNNCQDGSIMSVTGTIVSTMGDQAESFGKACSKMNANVASAQQAMVNLAQTAMNAGQCANESAATDSLAEMCKVNPSFVGCAALTTVDCSSSTMSTNRVCVCAANPMDPTCNLNTTNTNGNAIAAGGGFDQSSTGTNGDGLGLSGGDLPSLPEIAQGALPKGGNDQAIDGKQGGGTGFGSGGAKGGLAGGGKNGAGGGAEGKDTQVTAGFYGGGGGGGGWGSGGAGRGGAGGRYGEEGMPGAKAVNPDLRQFLPGGKYDPKFRGLAGMSGPDGITGPNSSIWKKIQNRYQVMSPSLLP